MSTIKESEELLAVYKQLYTDQINIHLKVYEEREAGWRGRFAHQFTTMYSQGIIHSIEKLNSDQKDTDGCYPRTLYQASINTGSFALDVMKEVLGLPDVTEYKIIMLAILYHKIKVQK